EAVDVPAEGVDRHGDLAAGDQAGPGEGRAPLPPVVVPAAPVGMGPPDLHGELRIVPQQLLVRGELLVPQPVPILPAPPHDPPAAPAEDPPAHGRHGPDPGRRKRLKERHPLISPTPNRTLRVASRSTEGAERAFG